MHGHTTNYYPAAIGIVISGMVVFMVATLPVIWLLAPFVVLAGLFAYKLGC